MPIAADTRTRIIQAMMALGKPCNLYNISKATHLHVHHVDYWIHKLVRDGVALCEETENSRKYFLQPIFYQRDFAQSFDERFDKLFKLIDKKLIIADETIDRRDAAFYVLTTIVQIIALELHIELPRYNTPNKRPHLRSPRTLGREKDMRRHLKEEVLLTYHRKRTGDETATKPKCELCDEMRPEALTLDHIGGGGSRHRREVGFGTSVYLWCKKNKYPDGFRVLCMNHQVEDDWNRRYGNKEPSSKQRHHWRVREEVLAHYSGGSPHCAMCPQTRLDFLTIHHPKNDGAKHRKEIGYGKLYDWLYKERFPEGYKVLCYNCQFVSWQNRATIAS